MSQWAGVVLAAGMGTRMKSRLPKVLHRVCGKEMVRYPVELLRRLGADRTVVVVSPANRAEIERALGDQVEYVEQASPNGTGGAVAESAKLLQAKLLQKKDVQNPEHLLVLGSDSPLLKEETLRQLMAHHLEDGNYMSILSAIYESPGDLGRIRRDGNGWITGIIEAASGAQPETGPSDSSTEINGGVYCFDAPWLWDNLPRIEPSQSGELYLTSLASFGSGNRGSDNGGVGDVGEENRSKISGIITHDSVQLQGVNNRVQLAQAEAAMRQRINRQWMLSGVTILDPASVFIDAEVTIGQDSVILPNTMLLGSTTVGEDSEIGPGSVLRDSWVGDRCRVTSSMLEEATMEEGSNIGPFSHLRPGAYLESGVHIGNFAEVKESRLAQGTLMGHFGYVGDASIGANVNLGAGIVTCNYDGRDKHQTNIGAGAFVGCDTMLVAPVTVGAEAVTGAGSVITKDVPPGRLAVGVPARIVDKSSGES
ncbi:MAG: UDP-N-acetylglucosamine diphosphorylase/glucosamine-1-phosphate N-acetyltransferase [SAR202 cluster bacterium Io17-Chloro-G7]|nr:MAG: UDP-N-acetylglucosamine diphosphorylase/glucosamine-1-phosphate N-acetyltransferase [SAR202 cluster bacterium Io17-Chloro-G7]